MGGAVWGEVTGEAGREDTDREAGRGRLAGDRQWGGNSVEG